VVAYLIETFGNTDSYTIHCYTTTVGPEQISIIVPVANGGKFFLKCLDSLAVLSPTPREIIVVADGDSDGSRTRARDFGAKVLVSQTSQGPANARNLGAESAEGDVLLFLDSDVTVPPNIVKKVCDEFALFPSTAALIGSYDVAPTDPSYLSQYKNLFHHYTHQSSSERAFTFWGACGAIRRSVFMEVGGFDDERYRRPCIEDIELGYRLTREGQPIRLCKDIQVTHLKSWKPISYLKTEIFDRALPWSELILKQHHIEADLNLSYRNRISVLGIFLVMFLVLFGFYLPGAWLAVVPLALGLLLTNFKLYQFFAKKRGWDFCCFAIGCHWLYLVYGGCSFAYATFKHYVISPFWLFGQKSTASSSRQQ